MQNVDHPSIQESDEIVLGYLVIDGRYVYPIRDSVLSLLSDEDVDVQHYQQHFDAINAIAPQWKSQADSNLQRIRESQESSDGDWNRAEMRYYDSEVDTDEKRIAMRDNIREKNLPHIFIPRDKFILRYVKPSIENKVVVEIGCGNARTVAKLMPPLEYKYDYVGTDIAFYRLVVAKMACSDGESVQASAFNLPLKNNIADVGISFGMLHHLPEPINGIRDLNRVLKENSVVGIHEPIETQKIVVGKLPKLEAALTTYEHSDRDGEIDLSAFSAELQSLGYDKIGMRLLASPFRSVANYVLQKTIPLLLHNGAVTSLIYSVDSLLIATVCKLSGKLKPRAVAMLYSRGGKV
ncbi:MAG: class I SAM-dependent methyltransferase [Rubripirellula sp.]